MDEDVEKLKMDVKHDIGMIVQLLKKHEVEIRNLKLVVETGKQVKGNEQKVYEVDIYG